MKLCLAPFADCLSGFKCGICTMEQMRENQLVRYDVTGFIDGDIDVLDVNNRYETGPGYLKCQYQMIIHDADNMGLSQLYGLRGRVGGSNGTAYAFLMYRRKQNAQRGGGKTTSTIAAFGSIGQR